MNILSLGSLSLSSNVRVAAINLRWKLEIMYPSSMSVDDIHEGHLEGIRQKLLVNSDNKYDKEGYYMKEILHKILLNKESYRVEDVHISHIELGERIVRTFQFEPFYVVPYEVGSLNTGLNSFEGVVKTIAEETTVDGSLVSATYLSKLTGTFYDEIEPQQGQSFIMKHPTSRLDKIVLARGESSSSGSKKPLIGEGLKAVGSLIKK
ncbi:TPA_asm: M [Chrysanthemum betacytorhabdovirus 1]|nr:TPA_asm: M [Chrysanthemum betacytorhabdovirus 1]